MATRATDRLLRFGRHPAARAGAATGPGAQSPPGAENPAPRDQEPRNLHPRGTNPRGTNPPSTPAGARNGRGTPAAPPGRPPRARHDAGVEPVDWLRVALVALLVMVASGSALATAGLLRQGPLDDLGWREQQLRPVAAVPPAPRDRSLRVAVTLPPTSCAVRLTIDVTETRDTVVVGPVRHQQPRFESCDAAGRPGVRAVARVALDAPVRQRRLLSAHDLKPLPPLR